MTDHRLTHIGGEWVPAASGAVLESINPTTEEVLATFPDGDAADVDRAVAATREAAPAWCGLGWRRRAVLLRELSARVADQAEELARLDVRDSGNPLSGMRTDLSSTCDEIDYYAGLASQTGGTMSWTEREPYGVVGRIVPFNHPFKFATGKSAAPLTAGNAIVIKPGEQTSLSALELARIAAEVLPPGVLNVVTGRSVSVGAALVAHPDVPRIAFTGSVPTGRAVLHGAAEEIKHVSLELGGKNPIVVFPDVDPVRAASAAVAGMNIARCTGQSCGSTSRLFVHDDVRDPFLEALVAQLSELRLGDPMEETTDIGPLAFRSHYERVMSHVESGRREGATLLRSGTRPVQMERGFFVEPAVFTDVEDTMAIAREEIFGPVPSVLSWHDWDDVVTRANDTRLGLTANVWTNDVSTAIRTARALEAGYVYINGSGRRPTGMPFGGWKSSGLGKEKLLSYTREKSVTVTLL